MKPIKLRSINKLVFFFYSFLPLVFFLQASDVQFKHLSIEDGLSQSTVRAILQDDFGFMWIGTADGLNRFDGYEFTIFRNNPDDHFSICGDYINALVKDDKSCIWIGTDMGLSKYDPESEKFINFRNDSTHPHVLHDYFITVLLADKFRKGLWVGIKNSGLYWFDEEKKTFFRYPQTADNSGNLCNHSIFALCFSGPNTLWIGTNIGLFEFNLLTKVFYHHPHIKDDLNTPASDHIQSLFYTENGILWIGTGKGLNHLKLSSGKVTRIPFPVEIFAHNTDLIKTFWLDRKKQLWLGLVQNGLYCLNLQTNHPQYFQKKANDPGAITDTEVNTIYEDLQGRIWVGTWNSGIHVFDPIAKLFHHFKHQPANPNSISSNLTRAITEDDRGFIWIGTHGGGLNIFDPISQRFTIITQHPRNSMGLRHNSVLSIFQDSRKTIWIGTSRGINLSRPGNLEISSLPSDNPFPEIFHESPIYAILEDSQSTLWFGTNQGLFHFDIPTNKVIHYTHQPGNNRSISSNTIWHLIEDHRGTLWVATHYNGLNRFNRNSNNFTRFQHNPLKEKSLSSNRIYVLCESANHQIWIGTNRGLNLLNRSTGEFSHFTVRDGLSNNKIYGILEDNLHALWLSTNHGLSRFNPGNQEFTNYTQEDGLQSNEFNDMSYYKDKKGNLYFGGLNGLIRFNPISLKKNTTIPAVILTEMKIFNQTVKPGDVLQGRVILKNSISLTREIILNYEDRAFTLSFVALNFTSSQRNQYAFKMEGLDDNWTYCGSRRSAYYNNLPAGEYLFRVIASNNDNLWNQEGIKLRIIMTPPFWQTWWFYSLLVLIIGIVLFLLHIYRVKTAILQERKKYELPAELIDEYSDQLIKKMETKKYYLKSTLTLNELASHLSIPAYQLSYIINHKQQKNFNEFINEYRIHEAKRILQTTKDYKINILDLAYQTGFNSKSVFNASFKKLTGQTPSQFKKNNPSN
jgi:ligand-binding sensor domain-containing protein/AraC-like DNA-binding protein